MNGDVSLATSRGDRRRERTRSKLVAAARALISEQGVAGLRIQEITERADLGIGSFYNYFASKEELVEAVATESLAELAAAITTVPEDADPAEVVAVANYIFIRLAYDEPEFARLVVNLTHAETLFATVIHPFAKLALARGVASGRFALVDIDVTTTAVIGGAFALIREVLEGRHGEHAERAFTQHVLASLGVSSSETAEVMKLAIARTATPANLG